MSENNKQKKGINKLVLAGIIAVVVIAAAVGILLYGSSLASSDGIAQGVYIGGIDVSGKTDVSSDMAELELPPDAEIGFVCEDVRFRLSVAQIGLAVNTDAAVASAQSYAKEGGFFKRVGEALCAKFAKKVFMPEYSCGEAALMAAINDNLQDKIIPVTPYSVSVGEDKLTVTNGVGGFGVKNEDISSEIIKDVSDGSIDDEVVITLAELDAEPVDFDEFCSIYIRQPQDATYTETDGNYVFGEEVYGVDFDREQARSVIEANRQSTEPYDIPAVITAPEVTVMDLKIKFSTDCLSSYSTSYASSDAGRAANVELAARKINGVVLNPGDRFSYNQVVGPRTQAAGFKIAHVYEGDRVVDGVGGGICQVSSTLYNSVLLADLKIVSRTNHTMPVAYVPLGRDATVSWGTIDFVFENDKKYPVKIVASCVNRNLTISVYGVKVDDTVVEIATERVSTIPFTTNETVDNSLKPGETKVTKEGSNGSVINTYKVYKKNGEVIDRKHTSKSTYIPVARQVSVGPSAGGAPADSAPVNTKPADYPTYHTTAEPEKPQQEMPEAHASVQPEPEAAPQQ